MRTHDLVCWTYDCSSTAIVLIGVGGGNVSRRPVFCILQMASTSKSRCISKKESSTEEDGGKRADLHDCESGIYTLFGKHANND
jgi:hypothetical protein